MITDEYVKQREAAERASTGNKEADRNLMNAINKEYRDEKAVKNAIKKIHGGEYVLVRKTAEDEVVDIAEEAVTAEAEEIAE